MPPQVFLRVAALIGLLGALAWMGASSAWGQETRRRSGFEDMSEATRAMQRDDRQNPAMLWVAEGDSLWQKPEGSPAQSCAACHGPINSMRGVARQYPRFDTLSQQAVNLGGRINLCRQRHQQATPWPLSDRRLLALETAIALQSRAMPVQPDPDPRLDPLRRSGELLFKQRMGQLNLSCSQCHDQLAGSSLGGTLIPQGHPTGYPSYRLEWQTVGSLQRRLRNCLSGVRAQSFAYGSLELLSLEAFLVVRAAGMPMETPSVRP
jgi:sulfur-oxidizing protein SoxA